MNLSGRLPPTRRLPPLAGYPHSQFNWQFKALSTRIARLHMGNDLSSRTHDQLPATPTKEIRAAALLRFNAKVKEGGGGPLLSGMKVEVGCFYTVMCYNPISSPMSTEVTVSPSGSVWRRVPAVFQKWEVGTAAGETRVAGLRRFRAVPPL